ncbi:phosphotransferase family protein [Actinoplanes sp. NPDC051343]|uniref:phosphotransferase family protein n=1 Tax=Actinoplanes sp. NPDC051343 TaxID=3363906 RepID=UPI0037ACB7C5
MEPMRHGYSHDTRGDGVTVVKRYAGPDADLRRRTERAALSALVELLPVPRVRGATAPAGDLMMGHVAGAHGQDLIDEGHAAEVLWSCGVMLRRIQGVDPAVVFPGAGPGLVLVHGDYGPNNMLFDPRTFAVTAVLDWEWAHAGDPVDDLAWCEWIVRMHHPGATWAVGRLFEGYGRRPAWEERQRRWVARCRGLIRTVRDDRAAVELWTERLALTESWRE